MRGILSATSPQKSNRFKLGDLVYVRYRDHVLFRDAIASSFGPFVREAVGWLDYENSDQIKIVWERLAEPRPSEGAKLRSTGLVILRSTILEFRRAV